MAIEYDPKKLLRKIVPKTKIEESLTEDAKFKRQTFNYLDQVDGINKKKVVTAALKAFRNYKKRIEENPDLEYGLINDPKLLIQRVENAVIYQISQDIKEQYSGEFYEWLPSDAEEPDPEHQLNYGKIFQVGVGDSNGEDPGERYGCRCGMRILVTEDKLNL